MQTRLPSSSFPRFSSQLDFNSPEKGRALFVSTHPFHCDQPENSIVNRPRESFPPYENPWENPHAFQLSRKISSIYNKAMTNQKFKVEEDKLRLLKK